MHALRIAIFDKVLSQRAAFFDRIPVGRLMTRMTNDIESLNGPIAVDADAETVGGATIVFPDLPANGDPSGWVHGIDTVLIP